MGAFKNKTEDYIYGLLKSYNQHSDKFHNLKIIIWDYSPNLYNQISTKINVEYEYVNYDKLWNHILNINNNKDISKISQ